MSTPLLAVSAFLIFAGSIIPGFFLGRAERASETARRATIAAGLRLELMRLARHVDGDMVDELFEIIRKLDHIVEG